MTLFWTLVLATISGMAGFGAGFGAGALWGARRRQEVDHSGPLQLTTGPQGELLQASLRDVRAGGLISVDNFGEDAADAELLIERYVRYSRGPDELHELIASHQGHPAGVLWRDRHGKVSTYRAPRLAGPLSSAGLDEAGLEALTQGQAHSHGGVDYQVVACGAQALAHNQGTGFGREHQVWELASQDESRLLLIRRWPDEGPQVTAACLINRDAVRVFKVRG